MLDVLLKNNQFIAVNKPVGIASQPDKTGDATLLQMAETYCKHPLHIVNRLDRPVSGIVLFAKNGKAMAALTKQFGDRVVTKEYLAVVQEMPPSQEGILEHYLVKDEAKNIAVVVPATRKYADHAKLEYRVIASSDRYHLLHLHLISGKHHQIRAQLAAIGCPIKGDVKYGFRRANKDRSIHLHAWRLGFDHPVSGERIEIEAPLPKEVIWDFFASFLPPDPA